MKRYSLFTQKLFLVFFSLLTGSAWAMCIEAPTEINPAFFGLSREIKAYDFGKLERNLIQQLLLQDRLSARLQQSTKRDNELYSIRENGLRESIIFIDYALKQDIEDDFRAWLMNARERIQDSNQNASVTKTGVVQLERCLFTVTPYATATILMHGDIFKRYIEGFLTKEDAQAAREFAESDNGELKFIGNRLLDSLNVTRIDDFTDLLNRAVSPLEKNIRAVRRLPEGVHKLVSTEKFLVLLNSYEKNFAELLKYSYLINSMTASKLQEIEKTETGQLVSMCEKYNECRDVCNKLYTLALANLRSLANTPHDNCRGRSFVSLLKDCDGQPFPDALDGKIWLEKVLQAQQENEQSESSTLSTSQKKSRPTKPCKKKSGTQKKKKRPARPHDKNQEMNEVVFHESEPITSTVPPADEDVSGVSSTTISDVPEYANGEKNHFQSEVIADPPAPVQQQLDCASVPVDAEEIECRKLSWIPPYRNQSKIIEELTPLVRIVDLDNDMEIYLYNNLCEKRMQVHMPLDYTLNVKMWFHDAARALVAQGYCGLHARMNSSRFAVTVKAQLRAISIHRFSTIVDDYINRYGIVGCVSDRLRLGQFVKCVAIPGAVRYAISSGGNRIESCCFVYLFDAQGRCFHRLIENRDQRTFVNDVLNGIIFNDIEFPQLHASK